MGEQLPREAVELLALARAERGEHRLLVGNVARYRGLGVREGELTVDLAGRLRGYGRP